VGYAERGDHGGCIKNKPTASMSTLHDWSKESFWAIKKELKYLRRKLERLLLANNPDDNDEISTVQGYMDKLLIREEMMWLQRSRITWLRYVDRNTSFFHRKASNRARKNKINRLKLKDGSFIEDYDEMKELASNFFTNLYKKDTEVKPNGFLDLVQASVTEDMNVDLMRGYSDEEIRDALF
jgi:hypothetical protein